MCRMVVAGDAFVCVSYYMQQWCHICRRSVDDRNLRALFTHMDYRDKLPDRLSALSDFYANISAKLSTGTWQTVYTNHGLDHDQCRNSDDV